VVTRVLCTQTRTKASLASCTQEEAKLWNNYAFSHAVAQHYGLYVCAMWFKQLTLACQCWLIQQLMHT